MALAPSGGEPSQGDLATDAPSGSDDLRLALPKGRLLPGVLELLACAGLDMDFASDRDYNPRPGLPGLRAKLLKPRAIPQLVALGRFEAGFCGLDLVRDAGYEQVEPVLDLGLAPVDVVVAVPRARRDVLERPPRRPLLVATEYERLADAWALGRGLAHITLQTYGSTEAYPPDDADVVIDCVETGRTLDANGLVAVERLLHSSTHLVVHAPALARPGRAERIEALVARVRAALAAGARPS